MQQWALVGAPFAGRWEKLVVLVEELEVIEDEAGPGVCVGEPEPQERRPGR